MCRLMCKENHGQAPAMVKADWCSPRVSFSTWAVSVPDEGPLSMNISMGGKLHLCIMQTGSPTAHCIFETVKRKLSTGRLVAQMSLETYHWNSTCFRMDALSFVEKKEALMNSFLAEVAVQQQNVDQ